MLFKNNMRPAFATSGAAGSAKADRSKIKDFFTRSEQSADDDFNAFGNTQDKQQRASAPKQERPQQPKRPAQKRKRAKPQVQWVPILTIAAAVVAVILLVVVLVAIFSAPQKNIKAEDDVYFTFVDSNGDYRVMSNGDLLDETFGEIKELRPAADRSFAYIFESVSDEDTGETGIKMYVLEGKKLTEIEAVATSMDDIIDTAEYEPGIIYKENSSFTYYSSDEHAPITSKSSANNFVISGDAKAVVYTTASTEDPDKTRLNYFSGGISLAVGPTNIVPLDMSIDGRYVYGIHYSGALHSLACIEVEDEGETYTDHIIARSSDYGTIKGITGMNVKGNEIIFYAEKTKLDENSGEQVSAGVVSYMYKIKDSKPEEIAEGKFTPVYAGNSVVCPETFLDTYFICEKKVETVTAEGTDTTDVTLTYFLTKKGATLVSNTVGTFSPDGKYFYYIDNQDQHTKKLMRTALDSKDFQKDTELIMEDVDSFSIIENGDVYVMREEDAKLKKGHIYFWDSSTEKPNRVSYNAVLGSMSVCANSIFFAETVDDVTTVYISTEGSAKEKTDFKSSTPSVTPTVEMGFGKKGYAYFVNEDDTVKLFYTSNGKKFSPKASDCTIPNYNNSTESTTPPASSDENAVG